MRNLTCVSHPLPLSLRAIVCAIVSAPSNRPNGKFAPADRRFCRASKQHGEPPITSPANNSTVDISATKDERYEMQTQASQEGGCPSSACHHCGGGDPEYQFQRRRTCLSANLKLVLWITADILFFFFLSVMYCCAPHNE